jgi:hypothetical protein
LDLRFCFSTDRKAEVRGFLGGDDFVQAMVVAVESVLQQPVPEVVIPCVCCELVLLIRCLEVDALILLRK